MKLPVVLVAWKRFVQRIENILKIRLHKSDVLLHTELRFTPPEPDDFARLQKIHHLQAPSQQLILADYGTGKVGIENTVHRMLMDLQERFPEIQAEHDAKAPERAIYAREQRDMIKNETANGPTFIAYDADGRELDEPASAPESTAGTQLAKEVLGGGTTPEDDNLKGDGPKQPSTSEEKDIYFG